MPWRRMTTPWKTWTRSRVPSTTRTCTLTVSPGLNGGTSSRSESRSMSSVGCIGGPLGPERRRSSRAGRELRAAPATPVPATGAPLAEARRASARLARRSGRPAAAMQVGRARRAVRRSAAARRHRATAPWSPERSTSGTSQPRNVGGLGVLGVLEQPVGEALLGGDCLVAEHARRTSRAHRLDDDERGELAARRARRRRRSAPRRSSGRARAGRSPRSGRTGARTPRCAASSRATAWSNRRPPGAEQRRAAGTGRRLASTASTASKIGSHEHHARRRRRTACRRRSGARRVACVAQVADPQVHRRPREPGRGSSPPAYASTSSGKIV